MRNDELVLGSLIMEKRAYDYMLNQGLFLGMFRPENQDIAEQILDWRSEHNDTAIPLPALTVPNRAFLHTLIDFDQQEDETPLHFEYYYKIFQSEWLKKVTTLCFDECEFTSESILQLSDKLVSLIQGLSANAETDDSLEIAKQEAKKRHAKDYKNFYRTNIYPYDLLGGFEPGDLVIIGGKSGHGKSRLALNLTYRWLYRGLKVLYLSYEMSKTACRFGLALIHTNLSWDKALAQKGQEFTEEEFQMFMEALCSFQKFDLHINEFADTLPQVELLVRRHKVDVFIVDTVNELISTDAQFWLKLGALASGYKRIAKRHNCICIMLCQLGNFDQRPTKKEMLAESKRMKNTADKIDFIYRAEEEDAYGCPNELRHVLEIFRVKGRFTGTGRCWLKFNSYSGRVSELTELEEQSIKNYFTSLKGKK